MNWSSPWILGALLAVLIVWWASRVDWTFLRDLYRVPPDPRLALMMTGAVLLMLRGTTLLVTDREGASVFIAGGWLLAATVLILGSCWPRE